MSIESILDSKSFSTLDDASQNAVRELYRVYNAGSPLNLQAVQIFKKRASLKASLEFWGQKLSTINPATFKFLNKAQRETQKRELLLAFYLFSAQYKLDKAESRRQGLRARSDQIKTSAKLLEDLARTTPFGEQEPPDYTLYCAISDSEKHAKYLGLTVVAPFIAGKMVELTLGKKEWKGAGKVDVIHKWMGELNNRRLYWVWGGGLLRTTISMLPDDFYNKSQAGKVAASPMPVTGYMSWILYYTRFGINLSLLLKHTLAGPWMSQEERAIPAWERFKTQWQQRKFALLNDLIWGLANMACFFWLTGRGFLGSMGDITTLFLLVMDTGLSVWRFMEESTAHNVNIKRYERDIEALNIKINDKALDDTSRQGLEIERDNLIKAKKQCEMEWKYKKYQLVNDLVYAVSLTVAFALMCCFFFPPAAIVPATALILAVSGSAVCFVLTLAYAAVTSAIDIANVQQRSMTSKKECDALLSLFKELKVDKSKDENGFVKKQLYLDMKRLMLDSDYQDRLIRYKKLQLVRSIFIDALLPPLIFVSLMFMPLGIGLGVLAAAIILGILSRILLSLFEPKAAALPNFDEGGYQKFESLSNPSIMNLKIDVVLDNLEPVSFFHKAGNGTHHDEDILLIDIAPEGMKPT